MRTLRTFDSVVRELGGPSGVCKVTQRSPQSVCNWRARGFFPAVLVDKIRVALAARGCEAHPHIFRIEKAKRNVAA